MLINKTNLSLTSTHELESSSIWEVRLAEQPRFEASFGKVLDAKLQSPPAQLLQLETATDMPTSKTDGGPFQAIMEMLFGLPHTPASAAALDGGSAGVRAISPTGLQRMELIHTSETESCTFTASGNVCLADGSQRQFDVGYKMERSEQSTRVNIGAAFHDPLALDFAEPGSALNKNSVDFDLDSDGQTESMRMPGSNSAVLFVDRNHNGKADDGSELFGPQSGNGFAELAKLDSDGNGWIDEGDAAYADLKLWRMDDDGKTSVESLAAAGVGALSTQSAETPFTIKEDGASVGQVRASSVWLGEKSGAGFIRQIDIATTPHKTSSV